MWRQQGNISDTHLVSMWHQPSDMNKQTVCGDAACHEVMIQVTEYIQHLCGDLSRHTKAQNNCYKCPVLIQPSPVSSLSMNNDRILTHNGSHLRILSKEPVLVTALHSQQSVFMLLFQLNDLLFQRGVHSGGVHILWPPRLGHRVWQKIWFIIMRILSCRLEALQKNLNKMPQTLLCVTERFTFEPWCCSKLSLVAARLSTFLESVGQDLPSSSSFSSSSSRSLSSSKCCSASSQGFWSHTLFWASSDVFTSLSASRWPTFDSEVKQVKAFSLSKVEEQRLPAPGFSVEVVAEDIKNIFIPWIFITRDMKAGQIDGQTNTHLHFYKTWDCTVKPFDDLAKKAWLFSMVVHIYLHQRNVSAGQKVIISPHLQQARVCACVGVPFFLTVVRQTFL